MCLILLDLIDYCERKMKRLSLVLLFILQVPFVLAIEPVKSLAEIKNYHTISKQLASSGLLALSDYQYIKQAGFTHVINLIPGDQKQERLHVESLGLSYQQIEVDWNEPTLDDFITFAALLEQYKGDKVYVHCQANYRASIFVYLYRVTKLGVAEDVAEKDLKAVWQPTDSWLGYIEKVMFDQMD